MIVIYFKHLDNSGSGVEIIPKNVINQERWEKIFDIFSTYGIVTAFKINSLEKLPELLCDNDNKE